MLNVEIQNRTGMPEVQCAANGGNYKFVAFRRSAARVRLGETLNQASPAPGPGGGSCVRKSSRRERARGGLLKSMSLKWF